MNRFLILLALPALVAFTFNPMSQSIDLGENQKSAQFFIENETDEKMAIELTVKERRMDEFGKETLPDTSEVTVFPPQMIIPAKEKRTIRVNWLGSKDIKSERSFRVIAEQLPLKVDPKTKKKSGIQMLMKYMAALYITPKDAESKVKILSIQQEGENLKVHLENSGNKHQILTRPTITFEKGKKKLGPEELTGMTGENILAGSKRNFIIKKVKVPASGAAEIKIED